MCLAYLLVCFFDKPTHMFAGKDARLLVCNSGTEIGFVAAMLPFTCQKD